MQTARFRKADEKGIGVIERKQAPSSSARLLSHRI